MEISLSNQARPLNQYPLYWAECFGVAPFLPVSRAEMDELGWDSCDIIIVTGDAYVFGAASSISPTGIRPSHSRPSANRIYFLA
jgi:hypothetical protein